MARRPAPIGPKAPTAPISGEVLDRRAALDKAKACLNGVHLVETGCDQ